MNNIFHINVYVNNIYSYIYNIIIIFIYIYIYNRDISFKLR